MKIRNLIHWLLTGDCRMCLWHPVWGFFAHRGCLVHSVLELVWPMEPPIRQLTLWTDFDLPLYVGWFRVVKRDPSRRQLTLETYYREHLVTWFNRNTCVWFLLSDSLMGRFYGALPGSFSVRMLSVSPFAEGGDPLRLVLEEVDLMPERWKFGNEGCSVCLG